MMEISDFFLIGQVSTKVAKLLELKCRIEAKTQWGQLEVVVARKELMGEKES